LVIYYSDITASSSKEGATSTSNSHLKFLPIGNNLPRITFDLRSFKLSIDHFREFSTIVLTVSWKDAEDNQLSDSFAIEVKPNIIRCQIEGNLFSASSF
jgi:hypothetical protein